MPELQHDTSLPTGNATQWETIATQSRYGRYASEIERRAIVKALRLCGRTGSALEIGSDGGRWAELLAQQGWSMLCTDTNQESLIRCQRRVPSATCIHVEPDAVGFPCASASQDMLLCVEVAPVIHADWFIDEAYRVLRKRGWLVGVIWNRSSWRGLLYHALAYPAWRARLCERGFQLLHEEGYAWPPFRRTSNSPLVPIASHIEHLLGLRRLVDVSPMIAFVAQKF